MDARAARLTDCAASEESRDEMPLALPVLGGLTTLAGSLSTLKLTAPTSARPLLLPLLPRATPQRRGLFVSREERLLVRVHDELTVVTLPPHADKN